ncbi:DUF1361 domain-containing protein [Streptococcus panodentis]|uniref:DUF1361 domain-containing protein n=1 Tax=Streptococcus panodentis TaxID=1581472 RepID=A0ABS5AXU0_9STRE|nr:DUF1361 domain-containing protein [Streptococcus panodentis]MBP2621397.1 DUF1361 domain-containing protein [Streptococcus panodentis]
MRKPLLIHAFFLFISFFIYFQSSNGGPTYLIWNMTLALIAYDSAVLTLLFKKQRWLYPLFLIVWLGFFPNTFYMITDLVHMTWAADVLSQPNVLLLFFAFVFSIFFAVFCGLESWTLVKGRWQLSWYLELLLTAGLSFISGLAIYIGRYDRLNTWDLLAQPQLVLQKLWSALQQERLPFVAGFALLQFMCLVFSAKENKK